MAKAFLVLSVFALSLSRLAQSASDGRVIFRNRNIATTQPDPALPGYVPGGNDNGTYNVPIYWYDWNIVGEGASYVGAGTLPGGVTVGLYYQNHLLATSAPVNIMVVTPVEISIDAPQISDGEFKFSFTANPGLKYVIKTSADLINWQAIATNTPEANSAFFSKSFDSTVTRFIKVERLPNP